MISGLSNDRGEAMAYAPEFRGMVTAEDDLFHRSYRASLAVVRSVAPFLSRRDGAATRLTRNVTAIPRLVAAALHGHVPEARWSHALAEAGCCCREAVVMLSYCRDLHGRFVNGALCAELIEVYRAIDGEIAQLLGRGVGEEAAS